MVVMHQNRDLMALFNLGFSQITQIGFHAAMVWRIKFADMQNVHA
jgi:hypothetical protein